MTETAESEGTTIPTVSSGNACSVIWPPMKGINEDVKVVELIMPSASSPFCL